MPSVFFTRYRNSSIPRGCHSQESSNEHNYSASHPATILLHDSSAILLVDILLIAILLILPISILLISLIAILPISYFADQLFC